MRSEVGAAPNGRDLPLGRSCILYQDEARTVTLLDLPWSIASVQAATGEDQNLDLLSCEPLEEPYPSIEPKTSLARSRLQRQAACHIATQDHENLIQAGLRKIRESHQGPWCLNRAVHSSFDGSQTSSTRKRKAGSNVHEPRLQSSPLTGVAAAAYVSQLQAISMSTAASFQNKCFLNHHRSSLSLHISSTDATYQIPPQSSFILTSLSPSATPLLSVALLSIKFEASRSAGQGEFDLILLDPPWRNRSARRAAAYKHASHAEDPFCGMADILPQHLAPRGFIACWITHAETARVAVEQMLASMNVEIVEEWTWAKVTRYGEPVVPLGSQWRRGWEVLIIGRRREEDLSESKNQVQVVRRLIVAVPDIHSRKPCLKELFDQLLFKRPDARVLEVFARHLVTGWCSVGDEVLRFNWHGHSMRSQRAT